MPDVIRLLFGPLLVLLGRWAERHHIVAVVEDLHQVRHSRVDRVQNVRRDSGRTVLEARQIGHDALGVVHRRFAFR